MKIDGSVALVTGANRGLGRAYARELVSRGAARVYGAARDPAAVTEPGLTPVALDITDPDRVAQVAKECADVTLLVNKILYASLSTPTWPPCQCPQRQPPNPSPSRFSMPSRPARSRSSPTSGPGPSKQNCPATRS